jgi:hypothetical protein
MKSDNIAEVSIDATGRLCVTPALVKFPLIYRAAMEVYWDEQGGFLHSHTKGVVILAVVSANH